MSGEVPNLDLLSSWQYDLPEELIASRPAARRDGSRLMVVDRNSGQIQHRKILDLPDLLQPRDLLVFNNTQVLPARLFGYRTATGGRWEGLFVQETAPGQWILLGETRGKLRSGETITVLPAYHRDADRQDSDSLVITLHEKFSDGSWSVRISEDADAISILNRFGSLPLPPYMGRKLADESDQERYQTCFATVPGAVAAPTAGLHFTPELFRQCEHRGIRSTEVTLHVGIGTFRPVSTECLSEHDMHHEWCRVPPSSAQDICQTKSDGGRIVAVGTTSVRTLESAASAGLSPDHGWQGETNLFIRPGYTFQIVDRLLTNFHLPGSTLIVLVAALLGYDLTLEAYRKAVEERYRFYSYGDAMLIL
ncbi:MAG: tRNA preQ1(34) S-adenosylmethionine ribosyltransferase-isomerase QueA [Planctomycetaceae bacterium]